MSKENLMFAIIGLMVGAIIGFIFANSVNKGASGQTPAAISANRAAAANNAALPPDHPPLSNTDAKTSGGGALPQVSAAIEKAKTEPQNYEAQMTAGDLYYQIQRYDEAAKFFEAASKLKPAETEPLTKAGNAYFDSEKYEQAEKLYTQVLEKGPKNISVRTDLGLTFFLREPRDLDRAIKEYERSLAINPNHEVTLQNLVLAYKEKGDPDRLSQVTAKLRAVNPSNPVLK